MEVARFLASAVVWCELHRTYSGATLTFHLATAVNMDASKCFWKRLFFRSHPRRERTHRTEGAPCAGCIDKRQGYAHDGGYEDDDPEHTAYIVPQRHSAFTPSCLAQLDAEHGEDKEYHKQTESECPYELWNGSVG